MERKQYDSIHFVGTFVQHSALTLSGGFRVEDYVDSYFLLDGMKRLTIPGTSIAGALLDMAHKMGLSLGESVTRKYTTKKLPKKSQFPSLIHFENAHAPKGTVPEVRQMNGLLQKTRTTSEEKGVLFNVETTPVGTRWPFHIWVEGAGTTAGEYAAGVVARVLEFMTKKYGFLGGMTSRGMGWVRVEDLAIRSLVHELWPDNTLKLEEVAKRGDALTIEKVAQAATPTTTPWEYKHITGTLRVGKHDKGWGIDSLMVGGSEFVRWDFSEEESRDLKSHYLHPKNESFKEFFTHTEHGIASSDHHFAVTTQNGKQVPFIPGSSLKGAFRHIISAAARAEGKQVTDPNLTDKMQDDDLVLLSLFGYVQEGDGKEGTESSVPDQKNAVLLVKDAHLKESEWVMAKFEHHAEDEFTQGVFSSAKFDEVALIEGTFEIDLLLITNTAGEGDGYKAEYDELLENFELSINFENMFCLGGRVTKGHGWPALEFTDSREWKKMGEV